MIVSIHQPQYIPWIPYYSKIKQSNIFVLLDDVQYQKNGMQNRNYVLSKNGELRLTIPTGYEFGDNINTVKIADKNILKKHWQNIELNYRKASFFNEVAEKLHPIYSGKYELLAEFSKDIILCFLDYLNISTKIVISSDITKQGEKSDLILSICKSLDATVYLTGSGGLEYLKKEDFKKAAILIETLGYNFVEYSQINNKGKFVPHLSLMDLAFNVGKNSINFI